jgi:hypothetical protein
MPIDVVEHRLQKAEWEKARARGPKLIVTCLEAIDAALWLIAGRRIPQAMMLMFNAIEIVLKAELERIHRVLIADNRRLDYAALKSLLREAFLTHPRGGSMDIPDFDLERTISFGEALERVQELYPVLDSWKTRLRQLQSLRNDVVHYGSTTGHDAQYATAIATVAFPFLAEFLRESSDLSLDRIVTASVFRELEVARNVCERLMKEKLDNGSYVLKTVGHVMRYTYVDWPQPADPDGWIREDHDAAFDMAEAMRREVARQWDDSYVEASCHVCGSINLFVAVEPITPAGRSVTIVAAKCPRCGLNIGASERYIAEYHVGALNDETVEEFLKDIGE